MCIGLNAKKQQPVLQIARNLRKARFDGGCLKLDQVKLQYSLDSETGLPNGYWVYKQKESNRYYCKNITNVHLNKKN